MLNRHKQLFEEKGTVGRQLKTDAGIIDILAVTPGDQLVVLELKAGGAPDRALSQVLAYMRWTRERLSRGRPVRGLIVAAGFDRRLELAAKEVPSVGLLRYRVRFDLEQV